MFDSIGLFVTAYGPEQYDEFRSITYVDKQASRLVSLQFMIYFALRIVNYFPLLVFKLLLHKLLE